MDATAQLQKLTGAIGSAIEAPINIHLAMAEKAKKALKDKIEAQKQIKSKRKGVKNNG